MNQHDFTAATRRRGAVEAMLEEHLQHWMSIMNLNGESTEAYDRHVRLANPG